jgi:hypothetical protein
MTAGSIYHTRRGMTLTRCADEPGVCGIPDHRSGVCAVDSKGMECYASCGYNRIAFREIDGE